MEPSARAFRQRGWFGIAILVPVGLAVLFSRPSIARDSFADIITDDVAWLIFLAGGTLRMWSTLYVGGRKSREVVCEGPYSLMRNPLYVGSFLLAVSFGVFLKSFTFAAGVVVVGVMYARHVIPTEEAHLEAGLGEAYRVYLASVPRFLPRLSGYRTSPAITVDVPALQLEARKSLGWVLLPLFGNLLAHLRYLPWWPDLIRLP